MTYLPSPATRLSAGLGYGLYETDVFPFTNQERFQFFGSLAHDYTARISWYLTGSYGLSKLDAAETLNGEKVKISGFGNFVVRPKNARKGRNPQTGKEILLEARRVLTFKPSLVLKNLLNEEGGAQVGMRQSGGMESRSHG